MFLRSAILNVNPRPLHLRDPAYARSALSDTPSSELPAQHTPWAGLVTVILTLLGWSSVPIFIKHFSHSIDVWTSNGWRFAMSMLLWLPLVVWCAIRRRLPKDIWRAALVPSIFNTLGQITFGAAHYHIEPGLITFGLRTQIVFVTAGAALLFAAERRVVRSGWYIGGLLLVIVGSLAMIVLSKGFGQNATTLGVLLAVGSGLFYACYALSVRWFMSEHHPIIAFAVVSQYSGAVLIALMLRLGHRSGADVFALSTNQWLLLFASAMIGIAIGHVFYFIAIRSLGIAISSGVIQLQPIIVSVASLWIFGERLSPAQWAFGGVALVGAMVILSVQQRLRRAARDHSPPPAGATPAPGEPVNNERAVTR